LELDKLTQPISETEPSGPDLEYDAQFGELDRAASGKPEQQIGSSIVEGEEADWRQVSKLALAVLERTRDLRVANLLTRALLHTQGFVGFAQGIELMAAYCEEFWPTVHPELDADDDDDPTFRINVLNELNNKDLTLTQLARTPLVSARGVGSFALRHVEIVRGDLKPSDDEPVPTGAMIDAAFTASDLEEIRGTLDALRAALASATKLEEFVGEKVGAGRGPNFEALRKQIARSADIVEEHFARRAPAEAAEEVDGEELDEAGAESGGKQKPAVPDNRLSGEVSNREEVVRALEMIINYYAKHEPTSPLPLLLERAKRLATMGFLDIIKNIAPDSVNTFEGLRGPVEDGQ
jgi:type VI secretion system protein ImpA